MADQRTQQHQQHQQQHQHQHQQQHQQHQQQQHPSDGMKGEREGPSASQVVAVLTLLPVGATLLFLAGLTLTATVIGLAVSTPLLVIFSPVLVPAALVIGLAVTGFLTSGAFGITALSALTWLANHVRGRARGGGMLLEQAKRGMQETAGYLGQKTKEAGHAIQSKAQQQQQEGSGRPQEGNRT